MRSSKCPTLKLFKVNISQNIISGHVPVSVTTQYNFWVMIGRGSVTPNTIVGFEKKHILNKIHMVNSEFYLTFKYRVFRWIILRAYLLVTAFFFCELHNVYRFVCSFFILTEIKILFSGLSVLNVYHLRPVTIALPKRDIILALLLLGNSKLLVTLALQHF